MRNEASDEQLIDRARQGDVTAFRLLVGKYEKRAYAVALGFMHNREDALDICQEAFLRVHRNLKNFEGDAQFFTWLYRILYNLSVDQRRRRRVDVVPLEALGGEPAIAADDNYADPERAADTEERKARFTAALQKLTAAHRAVLVLREVEGLSYKEIAVAVRCNVGTVMSRLFHARRRLVQALADEQQPETLALAA